MGKILYLEKRGCDFFKGDEVAKVSNVGNYRVTTPTNSVMGKDGKMYFLEFTRYNKKQVRTQHKRTGKTLKHPIIEIVMYNALYVSLMYSDSNGTCGNLQLEKKINSKDRLYTLENILEVVNEISVDKYTSIEFVR